MVQWAAKWRRRSVAATPVAKTPPAATADFQRRDAGTDVPESQKALLLHAVRQPYVLEDDHDIPKVQHDHELLVQVTHIGLNPIDWKAPDFNFGIPSLPYISGRELVGTITTPPTSPSRLRTGDTVIIPSTDYRDLRKAAFQHYTIASSFNAIRLPHSISPPQGSILGVSFVAAALALGINMGLSFESLESGPDLLNIVRSIDPERLPTDIRGECLDAMPDEERAKRDDFLVVWGGSSTCAHTLQQLGMLLGLKIISVADVGKHGMRMMGREDLRPDLLVDAHDPERAISVIRRATGNAARFGFDTQGKESAAQLLRVLASRTNQSEEEIGKEGVEGENRLPTPPLTPRGSLVARRSHLVGLTGVPKTGVPEDVTLHNVPIKLFHEIPEVGEALSAWCERLLVKGLLVPPDVVGTVDGLGGINEGLDRMRRREVSGGRLVAVIQ